MFFKNYSFLPSKENYEDPFSYELNGLAHLVFDRSN
jgi:hypothetical protein